MELKMEENYMATTRNGHELKDMYNPETNTLDITEGIDKLHRIAQRISNGTAYKRASYSVSYRIIVHILTFLLLLRL